MRYLYRVDDDQVFAYAPTRRDFYLVSDDTLWAHESHLWLLSATSSTTLLRRIAATYYDVETGKAVYYERPEPPSDHVHDNAGPTRPDVPTDADEREPRATSGRARVAVLRRARVTA